MAMPCVYILRDGNNDLFKIGWTRGTPADRIKQLSTGNPDLTLFGAIETEHAATCEAYLRGRFQSKRRTGSDAKEFFAMTVAEIEEAIEDARRYLAEDLPKQKEAERLAEQESDDRILQPTSEDWARYEVLLRARADEHRAKSYVSSLENDLKLLIGTAAELGGIATWKTHAVARFDEASFRVAEPELHQAFLRESRQRSFRLL